VDDEYLISETLQLKAVSNPLRMRMLEQLIAQQLTATQLGAALDMAPSRAHYHLKQLEAAGLCRMVEQREHAGILEKYYRAVAERFRLARTVQASAAPPDPQNGVALLQVEDAARDYAQRLTERGAPANTAEGVVFKQLAVRLPPQRYERMMARLQALFLEFDSGMRDDRPGLRRYRLLLLAYPEDAAAMPAPDPESAG
jgi:DNA-binding transcriptional ArsR family regulator